METLSRVLAERHMGEAREPHHDAEPAAGGIGRHQGLCHYVRVGVGEDDVPVPDLRREANTRAAVEEHSIKGAAALSGGGGGGGQACEGVEQQIAGMRGSGKGRLALEAASLAMTRSASTTFSAM